MALRVRVELGIGTTVEEPWALRLARDPRAVRVISGEPGTLTRWVILEHARGQDLPPGRYFVSVPLRRAGEQTTLQAPSEVLRCVFY